MTVIMIYYHWRLMNGLLIKSTHGTEHRRKDRKTTFCCQFLLILILKWAICSYVLWWTMKVFYHFSMLLHKSSMKLQSIEWWVWLWNIQQGWSFFVCILCDLLLYTCNPIYKKCKLSVGSYTLLMTNWNAPGQWAFQYISNQMTYQMTI